MRVRLASAVLACALAAGCSQHAECSELRAGCACPRDGEVRCGAASGFDLACMGGVWVLAADGPCGGDAGPRPDAGAVTDSGAVDSGALSDSGSVDSGTDSGTVTDAGTATDSGTVMDSSTVTDSGTDSGVDAGTPATMTYCVDVFVANTCEMSVSPTEITIPADQTAYFCWRNRSSDYPIDVWMSYGGGYTDLATGATWNEPIGHCLGPTPHDEYADISTACSDFRFLIHCL